MTNNSMENRFLKSAMSINGRYISTENVLKWLETINTETIHRVTQVKFSEMDKWRFNKITGNLEHSSKKFFTLEGLKVNTGLRDETAWSQPIINQPETGLLGIIAKEVDGVLYFLMQAKIEPGNPNGAQLAPTLQATESNYSRAHHGRTPHYLEYFLEQKDNSIVLLDQLQSEHGNTFLKKQNRNIIIEITSELEVKKGFCWLSLGQIKQLLSYDNIVNMDARSVIASIPYGGNKKSMNPYTSKQSTYGRSMLESEVAGTESLHTEQDINDWITKQRVSAKLEIKRIPLKSVKGWVNNDYVIRLRDPKSYSVIVVKSEISNREVPSWTQPMITSSQKGIAAFLFKKINGVNHFLVQAKLECGNIAAVEMAPTIQNISGLKHQKQHSYESKLLEFCLSPKPNIATIHLSVLQSEEGGRFFEVQNHNMLIEIDPSFDIRVPDRYIWMTLGQIRKFIDKNGYVNIHARSLLSAIQFI